jgi:hypothetical protein
LVAMPRIDKARVRVVGVIVLLIVAAASLHGYLPGGQAPARDRPTTTSSLGGLFAVVAMLTVSMTIIAIAVTQRSHRPSVALGRGEPPRDLAGGQPLFASLGRAAEVGLAELGDLSREPREAIIASYRAIERELEETPEVVPQDSDTLSDVLVRAVEAPDGLAAHTATQRLAELFEEALFSPHVMSEAHRDDAAQALQRVLSELRAS